MDQQHSDSTEPTKEDQLAISVAGLESACGRWLVQGTITLRLPYSLAEWDKLTIDHTLDYGAVTGQLRFILDASDQPAEALTAYEQQLPKLFPHIRFDKISLTITSILPKKVAEIVTEKPAEKAAKKAAEDTKQLPLALCTGVSLTKTEPGLAAASVLVCTGPEAQRGQWFLSPYHDLSRVADEALCLAIPYRGHKPTTHYKPNYYQYNS